MRTFLLVMIALGSVARAAPLPDEITFTPGVINAVSVEGEGVRVGFYAGEGDFFLLTHARRDLVEAARPGAEAADRVVAPEASREFLEDAESFWQDWWEKRFNYYEQQVTRVPLRSLAVDLFVAQPHAVSVAGFDFHVIDTPGYTRDGTTYFAVIGGKTVAFTGDLLWEGGRVFDWYSFQEAIPEAKVGGYHGHGGRVAQWIESLEKVAREEPDLLVPSRGPLIEHPQRDIAKAIERARAIYRNYLSTNALNWYFKEERMRVCGERVLGEGADIELMPYVEHVDLPEWCRHIGTTKLLVSDDGNGFVLDVGSTKNLESLKDFVADGLIGKIEGIWVTHTHNDHTRAVAAAAEEFGCPVYAIAEVADVLEKPGAWFLPGVIREPVSPVIVKKENDRIEWREFSMSCHFFPGQMYNHGGLRVEKPGHAPVFFIGDSFSPSGIDDYCLMNRNLMREDTGYLLCFDKVRALPEGSWLVNQHIPHLFRFTPAQLDGIEAKYLKRRDLLAKLLPWDDPNYGIDEQWAMVYPYGVELGAGDSAEVEVVIWNHSEKDRDFTIDVADIGGMGDLEVIAPTIPLLLEARGTGSLPLTLTVPEGAEPGIRVITVSLRSEGIAVDHWCEALVKVGR